jgi:hypothetical protein
MAMMGLTTQANNLGYYATFALTQFLGPVDTTLIVGATGFMQNSNLFLLFVTLVLHVLGAVTFIFMILPLIRNSKAAVGHALPPPPTPHRPRPHRAAAVAAACRRRRRRRRRCGSRAWPRRRL